MSKTTIGVVGGGAWGFALARAAQRAGNEALLCTRRENDRRLDGIEVTGELRELGSRSELVLLAVPSTAARAVAMALGDVLDGRHLVVHGVRGLSDEGLVPLSEIVRQETPVRRVGALGGPVFVQALAESKPAVIAVASRYPEVIRAVHAALASPVLRVTATHDLTGLEWASALVGALMVALGYARAVGVTGGLLAGLMTRGLHEAAQIGVAAGAEEITFFGIAGMGDLMAALATSDRPEVRFGEALASGASAEQSRATLGVRIEALELVPRVVAFARDNGLAVPVFHALEDVLAGRADKDSVLPNLMHPDRPRR